MRLRNKKTEEIVDLIEIVRLNDVSNEFYLRLSDNEGRTFKVGFNSLTELNEEWEDAPTEEVWYLGERIGNYSMPKKEARKATEKILAWKRLKDKGFRFVEWQQHGITEDGILDGAIYFEDAKNVNRKDLDLLFGGEE